MALTDIDIMASSVGPQNICIAYILKDGGGKDGVRNLFDIINGPSKSNETMAELLVEQARDLPFMNQ